MSSLVSGYNYDIFISYRQKDNKGDRWVSEFVEALKTELESTFKEEISVYFDINPHDGLLETHDVDASLKDKLKCLIFIPIISRTYCDPKSFAWEHEFKAFIEQASQDKFGLKVKLPNGNVASRVLPIRIYDLEVSDIKLCESALGGVLRGVDFVYAEPGINRPLKPDDDEKINLTKTKYRNQINKVGNAIKEIIQGLSKKTAQAEIKSPQTEEKDFKEKKIDQKSQAGTVKWKLLSVVGLFVILIIAAIPVCLKILKKDIFERYRSSGQRVSVLVFPFMNLTNDTINWNIYQLIIQNRMTSYLSNFPKDLQVRQTESVNGLLKSEGILNYASITMSIGSEISKKLNANIYIHGDIIKTGNIIHLSARLTDSKTEEIIKPFQIESPAREEKFISEVDSLSKIIADFILITKLKKQFTPDVQNSISTNSAEAAKYFVLGNIAFAKRNYSTARNMYLNAIEADSTFTSATLSLCWSYYNMESWDNAKKWCLRIYDKKDRMNDYEKAATNDMYAALFETPVEDIKYTKQVLDIDDQQPKWFHNLGEIYYSISDYNNAISAFEKALEIYKKWGVKPSWNPEYLYPAAAYIKTVQYKKAKELYEKSEQDFPDDPLYTYGGEAALALIEKDTIEANEYLKKFVSVLKGQSVSEASIVAILAEYYAESGLPDRAEYYHRKALSLEPDSARRMNSLAYFLIDKDRNISEGIELIDKALKISPDNYSYLHTKGWGLYKQGKYQDALEFLQNSWDLRRQNAVYDHEAFLHLEAAKKAVANQKNN